jgi:hypothetical protein
MMCVETRWRPVGPGTGRPECTSWTRSQECGVRGTVDMLNQEAGELMGDATCDAVMFVVPQTSRTSEKVSKVSMFKRGTEGTMFGASGPPPAESSAFCSLVARVSHSTRPRWFFQKSRRDGRAELSPITSMQMITSMQHHHSTHPKHHHNALQLH